MENKGFQIDSCSGPTGCPNRAVVSDGLPEKIGGLFRDAEFSRFLEEQSPGKKKPHRGFRIAVADCPNACSQPQIKDVGIIGASRPTISGEECIQCGECVEVCKEHSVSLTTGELAPRIEDATCVSCGQCIQVCPTGTLAEGPTGFRVLLGGKLGRHPRLAWEMPGIFAEKQVLDIVRDCIEFYMKNSRSGERFGNILSSSDFDELVKKHSPLEGKTRP